MGCAIGKMDTKIKSSSDSICGKGEYGIRGFGSAVDSAIRSRTASNFEISSVHGFGSAVDNGIKTTTAPIFETQDTVHTFGSVVDNAMKSTVAPNPPPPHGFASAVDNAMNSTIAASNPLPLHGFDSAVDNAISSNVGAEAETDAEAETEEWAKRESYVGSWQKSEMLGKGSFGTVYEAVTEFVFSLLTTYLIFSFLSSYQFVINYSLFNTNLISSFFKIISPNIYKSIYAIINNNNKCFFFKKGNCKRAKIK